MKKAWVLGLVLLLPFAIGQSEIGQQEDFEDDTIDEDPTSDWYTYVPDFVNGDFQTVKAGGLDGSSKTYHVRDGGGSGANPEPRFEIDSPQQFGTHSFWAHDLQTTGCAGNPSIAIMEWLGPGDSLIVQLRFVGSLSEVRVSTGDRIQEIFSASGEQFYLISFSWDTQTVSVSQDGTPLVQDDAFFAPAVSLNTLEFSLLNRCYNFKYDQWLLDGGSPAAEVEAGPSEFSSGLDSTLISIGIVTAESQMLFTLILVGIGSIITGSMTKFVSPGRFKNYLVFGVGSLLAVFTLALGYLELWMFMVAFVLGLFAVRGAKEVRNTYHEIRQKIKESREASGLEQQASEAIEDIREEAEGRDEDEEDDETVMQENLEAAAFAAELSRAQEEADSASSEPETMESSSPDPDPVDDGDDV